MKSKQCGLNGPGGEGVEAGGAAVDDSPERAATAAASFSLTRSPPPLSKDELDRLRTDALQIIAKQGDLGLEPVVSARERAVPEDRDASGPRRSRRRPFALIDDLEEGFAGAGPAGEHGRFPLRLGDAQAARDPRLGAPVRGPVGALAFPTRLLPDGKDQAGRGGDPARLHIYRKLPDLLAVGEREHVAADRIERGDEGQPDGSGGTRLDRIDSG